MQTPLWQPQPEAIRLSNMARFAHYLNSTFHTDFTFDDQQVDYEPLHAWSVSHATDFWSAVWDFFEVKGSYQADNLVTNAEKMPGCEWFPGAKLNFAENLLSNINDDIAIIAHDESGRRFELSYKTLYVKVAKLAHYLKSLGVKKGDRVAGFVPNSAETVIAMLATTSLGAVWSSCSPDFGINGVIDRFGQITPKVLFVTNGYYYGGKSFDTTDKVDQIASKLSDVQAIVLIPFLNAGDTPQVDTITFDQAIENDAETLAFEPMAFSDPLYIMYSSGTTGVPKCITHSVGGTLLQHLKEHALHGNLKENDRIFYYTTCGWMMWNWLVSALALKATIVLYDGSPFYPSPETLWDLIDEESINTFGSSAKFYAACEKADLSPVNSHDLSSLNTLLSTGSPLAHESFDYIYRDVKQDVCLSSISGGTDIISCFALGATVLPVYRGELQCIGLGMDVAFFDDNANELSSGKGELVCKSPFPSMPTGFWNDPDNSKYQSAYFDRFPNIWAHGDYGEIISHESPAQKGIVIHGRSDAVLNPGGVRIGTAEIYRQVEKVDDVLESIAIGQNWQDDVRVVLFVKLKEGKSLTDSLVDNIKQIIRKNTTPRHVPAKILSVQDIPRTISGKIVELAVRNVVHGKEVKNKDALANPEALEYFRDREELSS